MKLIESSAEYIPQDYTYEGITKHIEKCARVCYKSENKQSKSFEDSEKFVKRLIDSGHTSMLEHGTVYLTERWKTDNDNFPESKFKHNPYSKVIELYPYQHNKLCYVTTNLRVIQENEWLDDLRFICEPTENHNKRYTFKLITSVGIVRELLRHRTFSFANESTRYCNYNKDKFDNGITFIKPYWYDEKCDVIIHDSTFDDWRVGDEFLGFLAGAEDTYKILINKGITAQQAREVLPLCTKSELIMTGFKSDWDHFFDLRLCGKTGEPHPDMKILAQKIKDEFDKYNL